MEADSQEQIDSIEDEKEKIQQKDVEGGLKKCQGMSKKQVKKMIKKEKWEKEKLIRRQQKRAKEKEKKKLKKQKEAEQKMKEDPEPKMQEQENNALMRKRRIDYVQKMKEGVAVVIDLQFYNLMTQKQQNSLIRQLSHCHASNRKNQRCFNYILTSASKEMQELFAQKYNVDKWGISIHEESIEEVFGKEKLIYLTGDAQKQIETLEQQHVYVIGGIVDHNRLKKITYEYAKERGIEARRLPMQKVKLKASVHLAVNHVWQWMLKQYNGSTWDDALKEVLPMRKLQTYTDQ